MAQVIEILPRGKEVKVFVYPTWPMQLLLVIRRWKDINSLIDIDLISPEYSGFSTRKIKPLMSEEFLRAELFFQMHLYILW